MCGTSRRVSSRKLWFTAALGAVVALALAGTAWSGEGREEGKGEGPKKDEVFKLTTSIQVPGAASFFSFDIAWVDNKLNKLYYADRNNKAIDVIDLTTKAITQFINPAYAGFSGNNDTSGPDGVLVVNHKEIWVGDSNTDCPANTPPHTPPVACNGNDPAHTPGSGRVWVLDATNNGALVTPPSGGSNPILVGGNGRADELCYDERNHLIMIANPADGFVTIINAVSKKITGRIIFDGASTPPAVVNGVKVIHSLETTNGIEQCGWSPETGKFYQNIPEVKSSSSSGNDTAPGYIVIIDGKEVEVEGSFQVPIEACAGPQGMAINGNKVLEGCNAASPDSSGGTAGTTGTGHRNLAILNLKSGALVKTIPDLGGADAVWFNEGDGHYFVPSCNTACRTAVPPAGAKEVLGVIDSKGNRLDQSVTVATVTTTPTSTSGNPRTIHSGATNPETNETFIGIPAPGGKAPAWAPTVCEDAPAKVGTPTNAGGCIVVFATHNDDRPRFSHERKEGDREHED